MKFGKEAKKKLITINKLEVFILRGHPTSFNSKRDFNDFFGGKKFFVFFKRCIVARQL